MRRVVRKVIEEEVDIDKLLIVTFTNAAAAEMKERILEELYKEIEENPENKKIQKQIILLGKANISTIHSFCLDVIKNYFYEIDISPNFRLSSTEEIELLKQEVMEDLFEKLYEENSPEFVNLINTYTNYRGDEELKNIILKIYTFIQSTPFPEEWINEQTEKFSEKSLKNVDFSETIWGKILIENFKEEIESHICALEEIKINLSEYPDLEKHKNVIEEDLNELKRIIEKEYLWDELNKVVSSVNFTDWPRNKVTEVEIKDEAKSIRDKVKGKFNKDRERIFIHTSNQAKEDIFVMYEILKSIENIVLEFTKKYQEIKKEKNVIDFNDIEHLALKILVKKDENGNYVASEVAKTYKGKFIEIAIDEYQDSNLVQEYILTTISTGNNIFMVGDVKQSIYKFRQARPELFLEKYNKYSKIDQSVGEYGIRPSGENKKIQLFKNFRSRKEVLDATNTIFRNIMSAKLGDIEYTEEEYLNLGASYPEAEENKYKAEIHIIENESEEEEVDEILLEKTEIEAKFVAKKIKELMKSKYKIYDKTLGYRNIQYKDIAILLRTTSSVANIYEKELLNLELPSFSDSGSSYFEEIEIKTIIAVLKIIDNPNNDIPLVTVLRSSVGEFTDNELLEIRLENKNVSFYESLIKYENKTEVKNKIKSFLELLNNFQIKQEYLKLDELVWYIYEKTGYYNYVSLMQNGEIKKANLKKLFEKAKEYEKTSFKGLYNFIEYLDKISRTVGDASGAAKLIGENENVIRIMSIHKSKGLEFPVVFLCGTGKGFNVQDLNQSILLHQDIGFGPKYINYERKIEYSTLAKEGIRIKTKNEILSEEIRLLYVALTRAKEKLIITGIGKELEENMYRNSKMPISVLKNSKSYLEWIKNIIEYNREEIENAFDICVHKKVDILDESEEHILEEKTELKKIFSKEEDIEEIEKILNWEYPEIELTKIKGKSSVSEISKKREESYIEIGKKPKFLKGEIEISKAEIGTITHLVMQNLDFNIKYNKEEINKLIDNLVEKEILIKKEAEEIDINKILKFTESDLYMRIQKSKKIFKEQPFYINIPAKEIYQNNLEEKILVQGIIDLYFIDENGDIVLVDYKTDYVKEGNEAELVAKYSKQLEIYKRAIEEGIGEKVEEIYIYSVYSGKEILF